MNADSFKEELLHHLNRKGYEVSEAYCVKNNGGKDGLVFHGTAPFSPVFYTGPLLEQYRRGLPLEEIARQLTGQLEQALAAGQILHYLPSGEEADYRKIRRDLRLCMVRKSGNEELLSETPHRDYGDFSAVVYRVSGETVEISMLLRQEALAGQEVGFDRIFRDAYINMMGEFEIKSMEEMLYETVAGRLKTQQMRNIPADRYIRRMCQGTEMYVMTHRTGRFGSAAMCYQRELERAAERAGGDYILIPASIHDLVFLPLRKNVPLEAVSELVRRINEEQVEQEERLSDAAYVYSVEEKRIMSSLEYQQGIQVLQGHEQHCRDIRASDGERGDDRCLM